ncbi:hypothetical protein RQP46_010524 [Phenoliferia psychrophenolica]
MSMSINIYSGALHPKRKAELEEIATQMSVSLPIGYVKYDVEEAVKENLRKNKTVRGDPAYAGLWEAMNESSEEESSEELSDLSESDDDDSDAANTASSRPRATARRSSLKPAVASTSSSTSLVSPGAPTALGRRSPSARLSSRRSLGGGAFASPIATKQNQVRSLRKEKSFPQLRKVAVKAKEETIKVVGGAQETFSQAWTITAGTVAAELAFLAWAAVPWNNHTFGPHEWLSRGPTPAITLPLPDLTVLSHPTFVTPLLSWTTLSFLLPLALSLLVAFPSSSKRGGIAPPNPVTFNVFRLSCAILVHYIFAAGKTTAALKWSFEHVEGYPAVQLLGAATAGVLAAYQELAKR